MSKSVSLAVSLVSCVCVLASAAQAQTVTTGWSQIPNTRLRGVCAAEHGFPQVAGTSGCDGITSAWSGGAFDTKRNRLIIWGGGHNDYYGNEVYAVSLDTQTIERLTDPGTPATSCIEAIAGGTQANARHTYDGIEYVASVDKLFVFGGSLACSSGNFGRDTWLFNFATKQWEKKTPSGPLPHAIPGILTAYDSVTGLVFLYDDVNLFSYDANANRYTQLTTADQPIGYHMDATIDPVRRKFIIVGYDNIRAAGRVWSIDIGAGSAYKLTEVVTSGGGSLMGNSYPGVDYDPTSDRIVAWGENTPNVVYSLDLDTRQWTSSTFSGGPVPSGNGTHGRWRYSPTSNAFVLANRVDDNIYVARLSAVATTRPNPPANVTAQ
jgi:hypothetical protein